MGAIMQLSVNICSYRYGHLLAHAIESVLNQTVKPDKIMVVDDGVGDCDIAKKYPVDYLKRKRNFGIVDNFNDVLRRVNTEWVMFLGADNWLHPKTIEHLSQLDNDIITYDCYMVGNWDMTDMAQYEQDGYPVWKTNGTPHGSSMYRTSKATKYKASGNKKSEEDSVMFNEMIANGASVGYVERPLLYYRKHRGNFQ